MTLLDDLTQLVTTWYEDPTKAWACEDLSTLIARNTSPLNETQTHTLICIANGRSLDDIVRDYTAPLPTVKWRIQRIHRLYNTNSSAVAVTSALRAGHIDLDDLEGRWEGTEATTREVQSIQAVADHGTNAAAAAALGMEWTQVKGFLHRAAVKAGTSKRVQLVVRAYREGWVR